MPDFVIDEHTFDWYYTEKLVQGFSVAVMPDWDFDGNIFFGFIVSRLLNTLLMEYATPDSFIDDIDRLLELLVIRMAESGYKYDGIVYKTEISMRVKFSRMNYKWMR